MAGDESSKKEETPQVNKGSSKFNLQQEEGSMSARVSYQYPKGNFRFPLISDDEVKKHIDRRPRRKKNEGATPITKPTPIKQKQVASKSKTKEAFKATDVPSPVHGYHSTLKEEKQQAIIEFELSSSYVPPITENLNNSLLLQDEMDREDISQLNVDHVLVDELIEWHDQEEIALSQGNTEEQTYNEEVIHTEDINQYDSTNISDAMLESDENEPQEELEEELKQTSPEESSNSPKRYVPFNVVMLKQDREKLRDKVDSQDIKQEEILGINQNINQNDKQHQIIANEKSEQRKMNYQFPPLHFLTMPKHDVNVDDQWLIEQQELLDLTLHHFNVRAKVVNVTQGPSVTRFEVHPEPGVKVNKITNLSDDIKLSLSAKDIRMEAPIPGKNTIGIEVPNKKSKPVLLSEIISSQAFRGNPSPLTVALGLDISGKPIVTDLKKMPHGLIAGATGSGKSVCINAMLISLLYKATPSEVKLLLIDPKMVELAPYNEIPHLVSPVITDVKAATAALKWAVEEMERRYERFAHTGVRDISRYNELVREHNEPSGEMPFLVIVIDELADLMMVAPGDVEESICRIAQKARACGIHLLLATQRPSVDVITGLIKANIPTRIAFSVSSQVDSRTIIDSIGADKLLGKGDMLFLENGSSKPYRLQGNFVSDQEIEKAVSFAKAQQKPEYLFEQQELLSKANTFIQEEDELFLEACEFVIDQGGASSSSLQRRFRIGYNRAARLIEMMEEQGFISEQKGSKPRDVLITEDQLVEKQQNN
ncbi:DNA translocase FtsK [Bacillus mesophilus]|uniref:DNA translocase FtsK n=2 Tax=Bacillus mesophilus TaxID=1808955 RepID=A0A6M0Q6K1_9BACI|nr:DNA translocase FtsK [Bacillus mesophilus]